MFSCLQTLYPFIFFFFNDTATTEIYTLSLHDALPILKDPQQLVFIRATLPKGGTHGDFPYATRSEEHTSELQSHLNLVCRLLLEKKKKMALDLICIGDDSQDIHTLSGIVSCFQLLEAC